MGDPEAGVDCVIEADRQGRSATPHRGMFLALEMLLAAGWIDGSLLGLHGRTLPKAPTDGVVGHSSRNEIVTPTEPPEFQLPSGEIMIVQFIGVSDAERDPVGGHRSVVLPERLAAARTSQSIYADRALEV